MNSLERWKPGAQIVMRSVWDGKVQAAWPMTVVSDSKEALILYLAAGTEYKLRRFDRDQTRLPIGDPDHADDTWRVDLLRIMYTGDNHSYLAFWDTHHRFSRWYINLEQEYSRTQLGIDFVDHFLDIVIDADLKNWRWKDEQELDLAVSVGLISHLQAESIRAEGHRALERLKTNRAPFGEGWENWIREPSWAIPSLPSNWQT